MTSATVGSMSTIGNATLVARDRSGVVLVTDPWLGGDDDAYFGSWNLNHEIPDDLVADIMSARFVWVSHGHPDHCNPKSLPRFMGRRILLGDHVGGRLASDLRSMGHDVTVLPDRAWVTLSEGVKVLCVALPIQDSILLVDVAGRLFVNLNDAGTRTCSRLIRQVVAGYEHSYLLMLSGWGDADMFNIYDEKGTFVPTVTPGSTQIGRQLSRMASALGIGNVIPFSSFHCYQRADSVWAQDYVAPLEAYSEGFDEDLRFIPPFSTVDCGDGQVVTCPVVARRPGARPPEDFGDCWADELTAEDRAALTAYFAPKQLVREAFGHVTFRVGGRDARVAMEGPHERGITFEVPRGSLMAAVRHRVFDDLLIANFMRTTFHGGLGSLYDPNFNFWVTKYADNGMAESRSALRDYLREYRRRAGADWDVSGDAEYPGSGSNRQYFGTALVEHSAVSGAVAQAPALEPSNGRGSRTMEVSDLEARLVDAKRVAMRRFRRLMGH
jgi:Beta-lactamase superfamily domain